MENNFILTNVEDWNLLANTLWKIDTPKKAELNPNKFYGFVILTVKRLIEEFHPLGLNFGMF